MKITNEIKRGPFKLAVAFDDANNEPAEILIYDEIGKDPWTGEGISAKDISALLNGITPRGRELHIRVNSRGGDVNEGKAIRAQFDDWPGRIVGIIDGVAASTASWMLPADEMRARKASQMFVHKSWAMVVGNADDMTKTAAMLDTTDAQIADLYAAKAKKSSKAMLQLMADETLLTAEQAKDLGLVDTIIDEEAIHNFTPNEINVMKQKLAALNSARIPAHKQGDKNQTKPTEAILMNRERMIALLNKWGVTFAADATDEQLTALVELGKPAATPAPAPANALPPTPTPAPGPAHADIPTAADYAAMRSEMARMHAERVTRAVDQLVIDDKLTAAEAKAWLPKVIADESLLEALNAREPQRNGADPVRHIIRADDIKTTRDQINAKPQGKARLEFLRDNWTTLQNGMPLMPDVRNANTLDSALTTAMLASGLIVVLQNRLPMLTAFTRDFGTDRMKPATVVQVPIAEAGGTAQTNTTDFEDETNFVASVDNIAITPARITSGGHLTTAELNNGFRMEQFAVIKAHELADAIQAAVNAIITTGNFSGSQTVATASFGTDELGTAWAAIAKSSIKNIALKQDAYKNFLPSTLDSFNPLTGNTMPGWDGFFLNTYWTGATANTYGFACNPQAIATASGLPLASPRRAAAGVSSQVLSLPGIGLSVELQEWYATAGKVDWANWEVMFGAALGDPAAGHLIKSA